MWFLCDDQSRWFAAQISHTSDSSRPLHIYGEASARKKRADGSLFCGGRLFSSVKVDFLMGYRFVCEERIVAPFLVVRENFSISNVIHGNVFLPF